MSGRDRTALPSPLLVVTDRHGHPRPLADTVQAVLDGGGRWIWFRDRDLEPDARARLGAEIARRVRATGGLLTVGGDLVLAQALGADGIHLGGGSGPGAVAEARRVLGAAALIGVSAHGPGDVAAAGDADYATLSPVFPSASKPGYGPALGLTGIAGAAQSGLPILPLGGVGLDTMSICRDAGAAGVAVMGGLMRASDPAAAARALLDAWAGRSDPIPSATAPCLAAC